MRRWYVAAFGALCVSMALSASAADLRFPSKPVRIITGEPGGSSDFVMRLVGHELTDSWGEQVIVDNRGAASGVPAAEAVAKASPDGYTLLYYGSNIWLLPFMRDHLPYDPVADFAPVVTVVSAPNVVVVNPSVAANSVKELIAIAKAHPGTLDYASSGAGGSSQIAAELFKSMAGVDIVRIGYKGSGAAVTAMVKGEVQVMFASAGSVEPQVQAGKLRALAVSSAQPSHLVPGLPTVAATGLPGYETTSIWGVFAPAKTPASVVNQLNKDFLTVLKKPDVNDKLLKIGVEVVGGTPAQFGAAVKSDMIRLGKVIKDAGIKDE